MEYIGKELLYLSKQHRALLAKRLSGIQLFPGQDGLLYYLSLQDGQSMSSLVEKLQIQHATLFKMVERMTKEGLLKKYKDAADMRTSVIYLTDKGKVKLEELAIIWKEIELTLSNGLSAEEKKSFFKILHKISNNINHA
ncbi:MULTISPECIES: MarR family winged helix-turn-helix transcriptional regulator [Chryseobacterium]|uniref:HTH-type transcriptional regulator SarZ n=1 Tax=Chryseobacterium camelliae TaxID=1265445 RepID=A0ABU0TDX4_9FLAO|nr:MULTISPECIES: MarR family transcriptional regulator [Chryseobacterium]MDT3406938.1 DNA-binding MarR family transcriptional regulator [Pseudacidovorax intermedius]MDQ1095269.1 DNA-binding MarR family transcriptional regulator [Chryseobacterium camelliae]MDQ1099207.1 DNA-binding MarR family transcriptional regulator [Chryseobacterium sp. SORGH_AS_1048]MDR6086557.1 DNA-binding MarR family transcriptional regulator [Chryseobacterium sp. SORGH_AS_0909]MDR6130927.1 DNA-binding MarR family transcr